jgi:WD40 repeat protein
MQAVFSPDGRFIASVSLDGTARIWEVDSTGISAQGKIIGVTRTHSLGVLCAAFSADGNSLATGGEDNVIKIWNWKDPQGTEPRILAGHTASVTSVAFSPDGRRLVSGSRDGMAKVWDTESTEQVLNLGRHAKDVTSANFSSDGSRILTASTDGTAIVWLADPISPTILLSEGNLKYPDEGKNIKLGQPMLVAERTDESFGAKVFDPDTLHFDGGTLEVKIFDPDGGSIDGEKLVVPGGDTDPAIDTVGGDDATLEISLTESATVTSVEDLIQRITYQSDERLPKQSKRVIQFRLDTILEDGEVLSSEPVVRIIEPGPIQEQESEPDAETEDAA